MFACEDFAWERSVLSSQLLCKSKTVPKIKSTNFLKIMRINNNNIYFHCMFTASYIQSF